MSDAAIPIRAALLREPNTPLEVADLLLDPPGEREVRVRVAAAGVCHSDVHIADAHLGTKRWPIVLGHEGAGIVEEVGAAVTTLAPGDHVAFTFIPACGACRYCRSGRSNLCEPSATASYLGTMMDGTRRLHALDGSEVQHGLMVACFATHAVVPEAGAIRIPRELPLWQAALVGCGVVTGFGAVRNVAGVRIGDQVCVIGCGGVGLQVIAAAHIAGAGRIIAVDRDPTKLERAREHGATHGVAAGEDALAEVRRLSDGGVDYAFEVVGTPETIRFAWDALAHGGSAVVVGIAARGVMASVPALEFLGDRSLLGCYYGSGNVALDLPRLAALAVDGRIGLSGAISHTCGLDGIEHAFDRLRRGEGARTVAIIDREAVGDVPVG